MPGIFGVVNAHPAAPAAMHWAGHMREILRHDRSYKDYLFESQGCVLGGSTPPYFNAITQPAFSRDRDTCLVMEGEIFNASELRAELKTAGYDSESANDADLMMRLYEAYGSGLAHKVNGLFIVAIWNERDSSITLINDRVGLHYLYYYQDESQFAFAPEMKALLCNHRLRRKVDPEAVADFFTFGGVFGHRTFLSDVNAMPPATILQYCAGKLTLQKYWDFPFQEPRNGNSRRDYIEELDDIFKRVIKRQTSDPCRYGLALSGGRDSRILAGYLGYAARPLHTFTFGDPVTDEAKFAERAARVIGGCHHHIQYSVEEFARSFEKILWLTEGPINTAEYYQLGKALGGEVDVAFNGHGGDVIGGRWVSKAIYKAADMAPVQADAFSRYSRRLAGHDPRQFFSEGYYPLVAGTAQRNFEASFADLQTGTPAQAQLKHEMRTKNWREYTRIIDVPRFYVRYRYPFFDYAVLDFFLKLPLSMRYQERVYLGVLIERFPKLADIPYPNRKFSVRAEYSYLRPYYKVRNQLGHFIVDKFHKQLGRFAPSSAISHNSEAYCGPLKEQICTLLLEGNRKRDYFRQRYLEGVIDAHVNREADHSFLIHKLVTFELFHKLLLDPNRPTRPQANLLYSP